MKNSLRKMVMAFGAILFVLVATPGGLHAGGMGYASAAPGPQGTVDHSAHASQTTHNKVDTVSTPMAHASTQCLALCQTDSTTRPSASIPTGEEEEDDIFEELVGGRKPAIHCSRSVKATSHTPRSLKIPLYLKYCSLRL